MCETAKLQMVNVKKSNGTALNFGFEPCSSVSATIFNTKNFLCSSTTRESSQMNEEVQDADDIYDSDLECEVNPEELTEVKRSVKPPALESRDLPPKDAKPNMIFLGAEEPMKDLNEDQYNPRRYTIRKVKELSLTSFGIKPIDWMKTQKLFLESMRQARARTQKYAKYDEKVWNFMQTEQFKNEIEEKNGKNLTFVEKIVKRPNGLAKLHAYSDTLSTSNPTLYENLVRIEKELTLKQDNCLKDSDSRRSTSTKPARTFQRKTSGPAQLNDFKEDLRTVNVDYYGSSVTIPMHVSCGLCGNWMRITTRRLKYKKRIREYQSYRCISKRCQTYLTIKSYFNRISVTFTRPEPTKESSISTETLDSGIPSLEKKVKMEDVDDYEDTHPSSFDQMKIKMEDV